MFHQKLIIFVKAPIPGKVKTRLVPPLTYEQAAKLYKSWAQEIFKTASCLNSISIEIAYEPASQFPTPEWLVIDESPLLCKEGECQRAISFFLQEGKNLGEKLTHAFRRTFEKGVNSTAHRKVVIIGSDSPDLPLDYISQAFESLEENDLVLGPTLDGGYYLIGLKEKMVPQIFQDIPWSTPEVFSQTVERAIKLNLRTHFLPNYFDIDTAEDLKLLKRVEEDKEELKI